MMAGRDNTRISESARPVAVSKSTGAAEYMSEPPESAHGSVVLW